MYKYSYLLTIQDKFEHCRWLIYKFYMSCPFLVQIGPNISDKLGLIGVVVHECVEIW